MPTAPTVPTGSGLRLTHSDRPESDPRGWGAAAWRRVGVLLQLTPRELAQLPHLCLLKSFSPEFAEGCGL
jgi:hypothetical protein